MEILPVAREEFAFERHDLGDGNAFLTGVLPGTLRPGTAAFEELWGMRPAEYHEVLMHGRPVKTPRWQQAYGRDYHYTGRVNRALPIPPVLAPLLAWARAAVDESLNSLLVNWYDGSLGHYMGRHRDSTSGMIEGSPIVTLSFGEERVFRLRPYRGEGRVDFAARDGGVFVMPYETNLAWTHEVPRARMFVGRRISVTLRGFVEDGFTRSAAKTRRA
ncbi:MAG: alpha-ketoglutarate-dependent dioxygenase AlkB [Acidobacteria bacterium]|nr:alpha-ketoglutarate-dependent dioxygenase AlkB [Acidobacteriota bacterium]MCA1619926.1 alpha-ketoglutarate-dependent dioxygenase AlkB [Acidobacteriota bacterium]